MANDPNRASDGPVERERRRRLVYLLAALAAIVLVILLARACTDTDPNAGAVVVDDATQPVVVATPAAYVPGALAAYLAGTEPLPYTYELSQVTFASGSATLSDTAQDEIGDVAMALKARPSARVSLRGYADPEGDAAANQQLSQQRAEAVQAALIKAGASAGQVTTAALGETGDAAIAQNRRVELDVTAR